MFKVYFMVAVIASGGAAYAYHNVKVSGFEKDIADLERDKSVLKSNQITLENSLARETKSREQAEKKLETQLVAVGALSAKNADLTAERDEYVSIFRRHDLTNLARVKPGLIEPRINRGTAEVFRSIENDSKEVSDADS